MNRNIKELLEVCEEWDYEIIHYSYSKNNECYIGMVKCNIFGEVSIVAYNGEE